MQLTDLITLSLMAAYASALSITTAYAFAQGHLAYVYRISRKSKPPTIDRTAVQRDHWPMVTVQLPVYNEMYVVERLLDAVARLDYPPDRYEVQLLDDSTDETSVLVRQKLQELTEAGLKVSHIQRPQRVGFKAGALKHGMETATGEFIAIFDADFVPSSDFLKLIIPYFDEPQIGMVQTRWSHLNENYSLLTRLLAFALDAHFSVEQGGRNYAGCFINFNGTAGIWRTEAIIDAGGWEADTLTEDLDLSYRAQLRGWKLKFAEQVQAPAELPVNIAGIKSQQFRWTKGAAESARKNLSSVLLSNMPFKTKVHATAHLLSCLMCACLLVASITSVLIVFQIHDKPVFNPLLKSSLVFVSGFVMIVFVYWTARTARNPGVSPGRIAKFAATFLAFTSMYIGLSIHNSMATFQGLMGIKSSFVRTPKFNIVQKSDNWTSRKNYKQTTVSMVVVLELLATAYFVAGVALDLDAGFIPMACFHAVAAAGFGAVSFYNWHHSQSGH